MATNTGQSVNLSSWITGLEGIATAGANIYHSVVEPVQGNSAPGPTTSTQEPTSTSNTGFFGMNMTTGTVLLVVGGLGILGLFLILKK